MLQLAFRHYEGSGTPLIILHGLFGSGKNWISHAKELSETCDVYTVDHRNHGDSPWDDKHTLQAMVDDIILFQKQEIGQPACYLGHSMGGLVAMATALQHPDLVQSLIVADIAPRSYQPHHEREFEALRLDVSPMSSRQEVDLAMAAIHPDAGVRQFLQMNLERTESGFRWKVNVEVLKKASYLNEFTTLFPENLARPHRLFAGPALFLSGKSSNYIQPEDRPRIKELFPESELHVIDGDHWLHHSNYIGFMAEVIGFLGKTQ